MPIQIDTSLEEIIGEELEKEYFKKIGNFVDNEIKNGKIIYPKQEDIFAAFKKCPLENLKVVILGQDPYHGVGQAHGLSFSVQDGVKVPPSLKNIYKELKNEYPDYEITESGNLSYWASQGVLLLNSILTVEASKPASHAKIGWEIFTDAVLNKLSDSQQGIIFVLWGAFAQRKKVLINTGKHFILQSAHPSPFSAHRGFLGNGHFKKINEILRQEGKDIIKW